MTTLTVGGHDITSICPVDIAPIRWQAAGPDTVGSITWTMEDDGTLDIEAGDVVTLVAEGGTVAAGPLLNMRHRRGTGDTAYVDCEAAGWGWYLDRARGAVPARHGDPSDDQAVASLVAYYGGPMIDGHRGDDRSAGPPMRPDRSRSRRRCAVRSTSSWGGQSGPLRRHIRATSWMRTLGSGTTTAVRLHGRRPGAHR